MDEYMIDCAFDSVVMSEERLVRQGFEEGVIAGKVVGYEKGFVLGCKNGSAINKELGCYSGFSLTWLALLSSEGYNHTACLSTSTANRTKSVLLALTKMIDDFPRDNPQNETMQQQLANIRSKFKQVCSLLTVTPNFELNATPGISF